MVVMSIVFLLYWEQKMWPWSAWWIRHSILMDQLLYLSLHNQDQNSILCKWVVMHQACKKSDLTIKLGSAYEVWIKNLLLHWILLQKFYQKYTLVYSLAVVWECLWPSCHVENRQTETKHLPTSNTSPIGQGFWLLSVFRCVLARFCVATAN